MFIFQPWLQLRREAYGVSTIIWLWICKVNGPEREVAVRSKDSEGRIHSSNQTYSRDQAKAEFRSRNQTVRRAIRP
jgi:hypothetical protein